MMRGRETRSGALLIEIVLVVLFFMLSCTVILRLFATVHDCCREAQTLERASVEAKNWAERIYAAEDPPALLADNGFERADGEYRKPLDDRLTTAVTLTRTQTDAGALTEALVEVRSADGAVVSLPLARYLPNGEVSAR